ncbi:E3 ubiquitin protein ligase DRIP2-like [Lolium rigidum]|uniref:E3 ubiquitin protein ligase DRIP2-like n=1 Tax=Lolium rigidum TaxID=89674 RepID=UPI001F5C8DC5|nr:E3 ubiquitin protein ligase DRIP2-like [Lolium rigidum]
METENGVVRVRRDALTARLTCPLCQDLFREASAFVECLHTFCRECIMKKIDDEEIASCPVCHIDLGIAPEEKLRPDHNIQSIRNKVFPRKTEVDASKVPNITSPAKRKERSLSSLVVETPKITTQTSLTGHRTKAVRRTTTSHITSLIANGTMKLLNNSEGRNQKTEKTSAPQSSKMTTSANKTQINADVIASNQPSSEVGENRETIDNEELQKPLHSLVTESGKRSLRLSLKRKYAAAKEDKMKSTKGEISIRKNVAADKVAITGIRAGKHPNKLKLVDENKGNSSESVSTNDKRTAEDSLTKITEADLQGKPLNSSIEASRNTSLGSGSKSHGATAKEDKIKSTNGKLSIRKDDTVEKLAIAELSLSEHSNKTTTEDNLRKSPEADPRQEPVGSTITGSSHDGVTTPVWFSLVSSPSQVQDKLLPQIPNMYLRIKDRSMQISSVLTYITKKLELASDDKLEILCNEWPICPSTTLHRLREQWLSRKPKQEVRAAVGGPAKEFVMELRYRRRPAAVSLCCMMKTNSVTTSLPCYCST